MIVSVLFTLACCNFKSAPSFHLMTSMNKKFILTNHLSTKKSQLHTNENQYSWYYVHFLDNDFTKIQDHIKIEAQDMIISNTFLLYLSEKQVNLISDITLIKKVDPEDKYYEESGPLEDTNYLLIVTLPNFQLPQNDKIYTIERQNSEDTFLVRIDQGNLNERSFLRKKQKAIEILTKISEVKTVSTYTHPVLYNAISSGFTQKNSFDFQQIPGRGFYYLNRYLNDRGITGEGEIVTVMDTLLDFTHSMFRDDNVTFEIKKEMKDHRKILYYGYDREYQDLIAEMNGDEHGTHVMGTIAGKSNCEEDRENISFFNGIAPDAKILFAGYYSSVSDRDLMSFLNSYGSRISSNSWGYSSYLPRTNFAYSRIANGAPDAILIFAAGNWYEAKGNFSIGDPGSSRSVLTVGAISDFYDNPKYSFVRKEDFKELFVAERMNRTTYLYVSGKVSETPGEEKFLAIDTEKGDQCHLVNKTSFILYYGEDKEWIHKCNYSTFPQVYITYNRTAVTELLEENGTEITTLPIFSINKEKGIRHASYSSSGPGHLGILKPDVVAPGTQVVSAKSKANNTDPHGCLEDYDGDLRIMDGTSMSTPNVAGAAALIRQYFKSGKWIAEVDLKGATTRALIINSAVHPQGSKTPDILYGHGVVDLSTIIPIDNDFGVMIGQEIIVDNDGHVFCEITVDKNIAKRKLQITMSYLDELLSSSTLIPINHDLDLVVISPSNKVYIGDHLENKDTQHASTNEKVIVDEDELEDGVYTVHVFGGKFVDHGNEQKLSIVASGPISSGFMEFNKSEKCLCEKCDPEHPGNCLCEEGKRIGAFCQAEVETVKEKTVSLTVGPLKMKRVRFVSEAIITSVVSKADFPGINATLWVGRKCNLAPGTYEIYGESGSLTSGDEKKVMLPFESNEICVAIFNINDRPAEYTVDITVKSEVPSETEEVPSETEKVESETEKVPSETEKVESETEKVESETEKVPSESEKVPSETEKVESDVLSQTEEVETSAASGNENNKDKERKKKVILAVVLSLLAIIIAIVVFTVVILIRKGKCSCYNKYKFETSTSTLLLNEKLLAGEPK